MKDAFLLTPSKSTSPFITYPFAFDASSTRVIPTSMITTPSLTISPFKNSGTPKAVIMISAFLVNSAKFLVRLCVKVTVESPGFPLRLIKILIGRPTI
ncbi:hypothetical protein D3C87_1341850 [compost metagenome]